jgi:hypothetical protein
MTAKLDLDFAHLPATVAIVGSRYFPRLDAVTLFVNSLMPGTLVISGGAKGVDKAAENAAQARENLPRPLIFLPKETLPIPARFFERNTEIVMATKERGGIVVAFRLDPPTTGGTDDTLKKCDKHAVPYILFPVTEEKKWLTPVLSQAFKAQPALAKSVNRIWRT